MRVVRCSQLPPFVNNELIVATARHVAHNFVDHWGVFESLLYATWSRTLETKPPEDGTTSTTTNPAPAPIPIPIPLNETLTFTLLDEKLLARKYEFMCPVDGRTTVFRGKYWEPIDINTFECDFDTKPDFSLLKYIKEANINTLDNPGHFWIPDPILLKENDHIGVIGIPGGASATAYVPPDYSRNMKSLATGEVMNNVVLGDAKEAYVVCYNAPTFEGFSGGPGAHLITSEGFKFSFIHSGAHADSASTFRHINIGHPVAADQLPRQIHNHGLSVLHPDFQKAYLQHVFPVLKIAHEQNLLKPKQVDAINRYMGSMNGPQLSKLY